MQRRSSSKRAFSPGLGAEGPAPKMPQLDGSCLGKPKAEHDHADDADEAPRPVEATEADKPAMPDFLKLSDESMQLFSMILCAVVLTLDSYPRKVC